MKLALLDDHKLFTISVANLLLNNQDIELVETYNEPLKFIMNLKAKKYDIIILDILLPEMNGMDVLVEIKKQLIDSKVIILTSIVEVPTLKMTLRNGANGFLCKDCTYEELFEAIESVLRDDIYVSKSLRKSFLKNTISNEKSIYELSPREKEVLKYICDGKTIKETAYMMELSYHTVQSYQKNIMRKFNVNRSADLIVFAIKNGLYNSHNHIN